MSFLAQIFFLPRSQNAGYIENDLRNDLLSILSKTRARNASEPRDKVFALFGLFNELGIKMDDPDYTETEASVFYNFTQCLIKWHNSMDILIEVSFPAPRAHQHGSQTGASLILGHVLETITPLAARSLTSKLAIGSWKPQAKS